MRHSLRYSVEKSVGGYWRVYDNHTGKPAEEWLSYGAAQNKVAELLGEEPDDEPAFMDADDRAAARADAKYQQDKEWA